MYGNYLIGYLQIVVGNYLTPTFTPLHLRGDNKTPQKNLEHAGKLGRSQVVRICPTDEH